MYGSSFECPCETIMSATKLIFNAEHVIVNKSFQFLVDAIILVPRVILPF